MTKIRWTQHDEDALQRLIKLKQQVHEENRAPLEVLFGNGLSLGSDEVYDVVGFLVQHAERVRDLLEPFDLRLQP